MRVILLHTVRNVGNKGDIKQVSDGFARNYLIPQGLAKLANTGDVQLLMRARERKERLGKRMLKTARSLSYAISGKTVVIEARADDTGTLYAAVTPLRIIAGVKDQYHAMLEPSQMGSFPPIKKLGLYTIPLALAPGISAELNLRVIAHH